MSYSRQVWQEIEAPRCVRSREMRSDLPVVGCDLLQEVCGAAPGIWAYVCGYTRGADIRPPFPEGAQENGMRNRAKREDKEGGASRGWWAGRKERPLRDVCRTRRRNWRRRARSGRLATAANVVHMKDAASERESLARKQVSVVVKQRCYRAALVWLTREGEDG